MFLQRRTRTHHYPSRPGVHPNGPGGGAYDPSTAYAPPSSYAAQLEFHLPYLSGIQPFVPLVENVHVHVDQSKGCMRLDYYSGADTFIINTTGASYEIVPVIDTLTCLQVCAVCGVCCAVQCAVCGVRCVVCGVCYACC